MVETNARWCKVRLGFIHPNVAPDEISNKLGLTPFSAQKVGEPRFAPNGAKLPSVSKDSRWTFRRLCRSGSELIDEISLLLERLEAERSWVLSILKSSGLIHITLSFSGRHYFGLSIPPDLVERLAQVEIELGIEVFPDWEPNLEGDQ